MKKLNLRKLVYIPTNYVRKKIFILVGFYERQINESFQLYITFVVLSGIDRIVSVETASIILPVNNIPFLGKLLYNNIFITVFFIILYFL